MVWSLQILRFVAALMVVYVHAAQVAASTTGSPGTLPRGPIGEPADGIPATKAEPYIQRPACGVWLDCRDLAQALSHDGPLPQPAKDQPQRFKEPRQDAVQRSPRYFEEAR